MAPGHSNMSRLSVDESRRFLAEEQRRFQEELQQLIRRQSKRRLMLQQLLRTEAREESVRSIQGEIEEGNDERRLLEEGLTIISKSGYADPTLAVF